MPYDLFISYSRRDNERGQVAALKAQIESSFRAFAGRDLQVFFDTHEIAGMDDWRQKIQRSLRDSQVFLAVLSPHYLASPYCRWEWEDYVRYEAMRQCLGEGVAPVFFVTLPDAADPNTDGALARWIDEIQRRQTFDLRPWHDAGEAALEQAHVKTTLEELHKSVRDRLNRSDLARKSPENLIKHNPAFVGRVRELTELRNALTKNKLGVVGAREGTTPTPQPSTLNPQLSVLVQGLGGMGKTELALAYAHAFAWDYQGGRWQIPCEHFSDLRVALLHLANAKALHFEFTEDEKKNIALAFERVLRELDRHERCLLILDNVNDPNLLQPEYLDRLPRDGRVDLIATTRLAPRAIPGSAQEQTFIAVDELPEEDALALMRSHQSEGRFSSQQEDDEARAIVRLLRGFTLAVETAAIYLGRDTAPDACRRFRERLSPDLLRESEAAATDPAVAVRHRVRSLEETLAFTLQTLTPGAKHLLEIASLLPADQIALPWLKAVGAEKFPAFAADPSEQPNTAFCQSEELLLGLRLFQSGGVADNAGRLLVARMHRLVQQLVAQRHGFEKEQVLDILIGQAEARCKSLRYGWLDRSNRWEIEPLRAFAEELLALNHPRSCYVANEAAVRLLDIARHAEAEPLLRRVLDIEERNLGPEHPDVAVTLNNLSVLLRRTSRFAEAERLMRRAVKIDEDHFGTDHPRLARHLDNLATILEDTNRLTEAEPMARRALKILERNHGSDEAEIAATLNSLGRLLQATNQLPEAEARMRQALEIHERLHGAEHLSVAWDLNNLAALLGATGRMREAEPMMQQAIKLLESRLGEHHPNLASALNNRGQLLRESNRFSEAEPILRRAIDIWQRSYGSDHPEVAIGLNNLALLLQSSNRLTEAESLLRRALEIEERSLGENHTSVSTTLNNLAMVLHETTRRSDAESLLRRALVIDERSFTRKHPNVARDLNNLAQLFQDTGRLTEAESLLKEALEIDEEGYGRDHPAIARDLNNLALLFRATNRLTQAEPLMRRALVICEKTLGETHPQIATSLNNLASLLQATNRLLEAEPLQRRALTIDSETLGPDHASVARDLNNLAQLLRVSNRPGEAEPLFRRALEIFEHNYGLNHPDVADCINNLASLLRSGNRCAEAEPLFLRAMSIYEQNLMADDPKLAATLNNFALMLKNSHRSEEAEPLYRRALEVFLRFTRAAGHPHPSLQTAFHNYGALLSEMGVSDYEIRARFGELAPEFFPKS